MPEVMARAHPKPPFLVVILRNRFSAGRLDTMITLWDKGMAATYERLCALSIG